MSRTRIKWRDRSRYIGVFVVGAVVGAGLFAATSVLNILSVDESGTVSVGTILATAGWGALFAAVSVLVGFAGIAERESAFGRGLFVTIASGITMTVLIFFFGSLAWPDGGIAYITSVVVSVPFTLCMAVVCATARHTFSPVRN